MTGLTSAILLAEAGYDVTIIAAHVPGDSSIEYTSPWYKAQSEPPSHADANRAGAHWMTHASSNEIVQQDWDIQTYNYMLSLIERQGQQPGLPALGLKVRLRQNPVTQLTACSSTKAISYIQGAYPMENSGGLLMSNISNKKAWSLALWQRSTPRPTGK